MSLLKVSVEKVVHATPERIFDLLADPRRHREIDGSGTVRDAVEGPERLSKGAEFGMKMKAGAAYQMTNTVVEFEEGRLIAWRHFHGHRWRYEFADVDGGTLVTETFDWSQARSRLSLELAGFPAKNLAAMRATLERLEQLAVEGVIRDVA